MDIIPHKTPFWLKQMYPKRIWDGVSANEGNKVIYLTFDDGPIPIVTPWVLEVLNEFSAKASFFCIGENLKKHREIAQQIVAGGHALGNHTLHHVNGWETPFKTYGKEVDETTNLFKKQNLKTDLFRPPYGRMTSKQAEYVLNKNYKIIMWDVLTKDYNTKLNPKILLQKSIEATVNGSIVVFHDSEKAFANLKFILPRYLKHFADLGYQFKAL